MTPEEFRRHGHALVDKLADYLASVPDRRVQPTTQPGEVKALLPAAPPESGEDFDDVIADLDRVVFPHLTLWRHPRFFGFFPSNSLLAGVLGDFVSTALGVIGLSWQASPALTEVEEVVVDWFRQLVGLSDAWTGAIGDTASTATLVSLITAREKATGLGFRDRGLQQRDQPLIVYASASSHSSVEKAALLAGFGRDHVRSVPIDQAFAMDPAALTRLVEADLAAGRRPCAVVATSGSTATTAFDPVDAIAEVCERHGIWLHVDAAMAGGGMILPELRPLWAGVERADSLVLNPHKWVGVPFDCSLYYVRDEPLLLQVMSTSPSYLKSAVDEKVRNLRDTSIPLGRRFRALKLWFALRAEGAEALRARLRRDLENARRFKTLVESDPEWRVVAPVTLQTVCVRHEPSGLAPEALDAHNRAWAEALNASGQAFVSASSIGGLWMVRISIGALATEWSDLETLWSAMRATAQGVGEQVRA
jgi:aromatic-L-amino-acid/L-tryptophan decarboxylase